MNEEIIEALEASAMRRNSNRSTASRRDIANHRDMLMRFLDELDGSLSVSEVREALEEYYA